MKRLSLSLEGRKSLIPIERDDHQRTGINYPAAPSGPGSAQEGHHEWEKISVLEPYELTLRENQFVEAIEKYFNENVRVTDQQESVLEGIYREKIWLRKAFFTRNNSS